MLKRNHKEVISSVENEQLKILLRDGDITKIPLKDLPYINIDEVLVMNNEGIFLLSPNMCRKVDAMFKCLRRNSCLHSFGNFQHFVFASIKLAPPFIKYEIETTESIKKDEDEKLRKILFKHPSITIVDTVSFDWIAKHLWLKSFSHKNLDFVYWLKCNTIENESPLITCSNDMFSALSNLKYVYTDEAKVIFDVCLAIDKVEFLRDHLTSLLNTSQPSKNNTYQKSDTLKATEGKKNIPQTFEELFIDQHNAEKAIEALIAFKLINRDLKFIDRRGNKGKLIHFMWQLQDADRNLITWNANIQILNILTKKFSGLTLDKSLFTSTDCNNKKKQENTIKTILEICHLINEFFPPKAN